MSWEGMTAPQIQKELDGMRSSERRAVFDELSSQQRRDLLRLTEMRNGMAPTSDLELDLTTGALDPSHKRAYPIEQDATESAGAGLSGSSGADRTRKGKAGAAIDKHWALSRCLTIRAEAMMMLPIEFYEGKADERELVTEGPLVDLFNNINPEYGWPSLLAMWEMELNTSKMGAFGILDDFDERGYPREIWHAPSDRMTPVKATKKNPSATGRIYSHFVYVSPSGGRQIFPADKVIWIETPTSKVEYGTSPVLDPALGPAILAMKAMKSNMDLYENAMTGAGIIHPANEQVTWTPDQMKEVRHVIERTLIGGGNWKRLGMMNTGDFKVRDLQSFNPRDAQFTKMLDITTDQICDATGVSRPLLKPTDSTFTNADQARGMLWSNTLIPRSVLIAAAIQRQVVDVWFAGEATRTLLSLANVPELQDDLLERWRLDKEQLGEVINLAKLVRDREYDHEAAITAATFFIGIPEEKALELIPEPPEDVSRPDVSAALVGEYFKTLVNTAAGQLPRETVVRSVAKLFGISIEEVDEMVGPVGDSFKLAPPEDGPAPVEDDLPSLPPVEEEDPPAPAERGHKREVIIFQAGRDYRVVDAETSVRSIEPASAPAAGVEVYGSAAHKHYVRQVEEGQAIYDPIFTAMISELFGDQAAAVIEGLAELNQDTVDGWATRYANDPAGLMDVIMNALFDAPAWIQVSVDIMQEALEPLTEDVGTAMFEELGAAGTFDPAGAEVQAEMEARASRFGVSTVDTNRQQIGDALAQGVLDGMNLDELTAEVERVAETMTTSRARMVARTEVHGSASKVAELAAKQSGVVQGREWVSSLDDRVRQTHRDAHGQTIGLNERYTVGSTECDSPGNCDDPTEIYQCRCTERWITRSQRSIGLAEIYRRIASPAYRRRARKTEAVAGLRG